MTSTTNASVPVESSMGKRPSFREWYAASAAEHSVEINAQAIVGARRSRSTTSTSSASTSSAPTPDSAPTFKEYYTGLATNLNSDVKAKNILDANRSRPTTSTTATCSTTPEPSTPKHVASETLVTTLPSPENYVEYWTALASKLNLERSTESVLNAKLPKLTTSIPSPGSAPSPEPIEYEQIPRVASTITLPSATPASKTEQQRRRLLKFASSGCEALSQAASLGLRVASCPLFSSNQESGNRILGFRDAQQSRLVNLANNGHLVLTHAASTGVQFLSHTLSKANPEPRFKVLGLREVDRPKPVYVWNTDRPAAQKKTDDTFLNVARKYLAHVTITGHWLLTHARHPLSSYHSLKHFVAEVKAIHSIQQAIGATFPPTISTDADLKQTQETFFKLAHYTKTLGAGIGDKHDMISRGPAALFQGERTPCSGLLRHWVGEWELYAHGLERLRISKKILDAASARVKEYKDKTEYRHRCEEHGGFPCALGRKKTGF